VYHGAVTLPLQVGSSLGGALAVANSLVLAQCDDFNKLTVCTVGCPKFLSKSTIGSILEALRVETIHQTKEKKSPRDSRLSFLHVAHVQVSP
jgi:hypothetical protein